MNTVDWRRRFESDNREGQAVAAVDNPPHQQRRVTVALSKSISLIHMEGTYRTAML